MRSRENTKTAGGKPNRRMTCWHRKQKVLRRFWYAVMPLEDLASGPKPFRLLGEEIVLFPRDDAKPAALKDRCCHKTPNCPGLVQGWTSCLRLSQLELRSDGKVVEVPQLPVQPELAELCDPCLSLRGALRLRLGSAGRAATPILDASEETDPAYRRIPQFYEVWNTSALRLMENSFDNAHFAFVHKGTFGQLSQPLPEKYQIQETDSRFRSGDNIITIAEPAGCRIASG